MPKYLIGLDGSTQATHALEEAATYLARSDRNDEFVLVHICSHEKPEEAHKDMKILSEAEEYINSRGFPVVVELIETPKSAGAALVDLCQQHGADFLVVGSRGLGVLRAAILGSVSEHCIHNAKCTVIVHRSEKS